MSIGFVLTNVFDLFFPYPGESAGGISLCAHLVSPASRGLFHVSAPLRFPCCCFFLLCTPFSLSVSSCTHMCFYYAYERICLWLNACKYT